MRRSQRDKQYISEDADVKTQTACLNRIFRKVDYMGVSLEILLELKGDIDYISGIYGINAESSVLLAAILEKSESSFPADDENLAEYLGCTNIEFLRHHKYLRNMEKSGIIRISNHRGHRCYSVTPETVSSVSQNSKFMPEKKSGLTGEELFSLFRRYFNRYIHDSLDPDGLLDELDLLVSNNENLSFCRQVLESPLYSDCSNTERRIFFYLCERYVSRGSGVESIDTLVNFCDSREDSFVFGRHLSHGNVTLMKRGLVSFAIEDGFANTDALALSDEVKEKYFTGIELVAEEGFQHRDIIRSEAIQPKELFFNDEEDAQLSRLRGLLDQEHFKEVQSRLTSCGMRKGFNIIFYGDPGTGKTASVYELARETGRDIFHVDMSKIRSKWVGESEKSLKGLFRTYRSLCRDSKKAPILLFNEADAIFSKRFESVEHSADQLNNTLQNIILEEMESLEGVLVATTNLLSNLDPAFERRFIYKVEFKKPGANPRAKIWKSMISGISEEDAAVLAQRYDFSGGNIENVARKSTVEYVLSGNAPTISSLESYCEKEFLDNKKRTRIGF